jgi:N-acetylglucosaminyl-diphospho-decaprenol L-rhamnosyltransferase
MGINSETRIAVILVNYKKAKRALESIASLKAQTIADRLDVVVVDNSEDKNEAGLLAAAITDRYTKLIVAPSNLGYTRGVNLGARAIFNRQHVLLLNPDIVLDDPEAIAILTAELESASDYGVVGTMQRNDDGSVVEVARRFPSFARLVLRRLLPGKLTDDDLLAPLLENPDGPPLAVDWVQSSFTLVRNDLWQRIGGLDELYRIFMADVALGAVAKHLGYKVVVTGRVSVRSDGLRASRGGLRSVFSSRVLRIHIVDAIKYQLASLLGVFNRPVVEKH